MTKSSPPVTPVQVQNQAISTEKFAQDSVLGKSSPETIDFPMEQKGVSYKLSHQSIDLTDFMGIS